MTPNANSSERKKILILTANPKGTSRLRLDEEVREIEEGLRLARKRDQFDLQQRWAARPKDIRRAMLEINPQIVHFTGHGMGDEGLIFEDDVGQAKPIDGAALAGLFSLFCQESSEQPIECVVLNGCYTEVQAKAIAQNIPYVIGMKKALGDRAAIEFAVGFYDALGAGRKVEDAFEFGRIAIQMAGISEHLTPVLISSRSGILLAHTEDNGFVRKSDLIVGGNRSFNDIDTIHVHVDGGSKKEKVLAIVNELQERGMQSKLTKIRRSVPGPQREDFPDTYSVHTPGPLVCKREGCGVKDQFDYFSTTLLGERSAILSNKYALVRRELKQLLADLADTRDIVIELERVIAKKGEKGLEGPLELIQFSNIEDLGFEGEDTLPLEIHYSLDIEKEGVWRTKQPLELENLPQECKKLDIHVGGWFIFSKDRAWAYRSNFFENEIARDDLEKQWDIFNTYLDNLGKKLNFKYKFNILVEQVLGVWKTPLSKKYDFKTIKELAQWEKEYPQLERFWVVTSNFLADKYEIVRRAMLANLRKEVEYTYFLNSFADFQRLRKFVRNLEKELGPGVNLSKKINAVILVLSPEARNEFPREWFVANPDLEGQNRQAYRLKREEAGEVIEGIKMQDGEYKRFIDQLKPLVDNLQIKEWRRIPIMSDRILKDLILICTEVQNYENWGKKIPARKWEKMCEEMLQEYDSIVAREVSKLGGTVEKDIHNGYSIVFEGSESAALPALACVERLQKAVQEYNAKVSSGHLPIPPQKIAIDYGEVCQLIRAYGNELTGIERCQLLLDRTEYGKISMTKSFYDFYSLASWSSNQNEKLLEEKFIPQTLTSFEPLNLSECYEYQWN